MFRQTLLRTNIARNARFFSTNGVRLNKGPMDGAKDAVKSADRTVSDGLVKGIEKGRKFLHYTTPSAVDAL